MPSGQVRNWSACSEAFRNYVFGFIAQRLGNLICKVRTPDLRDCGLTQVQKARAKHMSCIAPETWQSATYIVPACRMIGYAQSDTNL